MTLTDKITAAILAALNVENERRNTVGLPGFPWNTMQIVRKAVQRALADGVE